MRTSLIALLFAASTAWACGNDATAGRSVGAACQATDECRPGLVCETQRCADSSATGGSSDAAVADAGAASTPPDSGITEPCGGACPIRQVCDTSLEPAMCVLGCFDDQDCASGESCREQIGRVDTAEKCRALDPRSGQDPIGLCCDPR